MEVKMCDVSTGDNSYRYIELKRGKLTFKMRTQKMKRLSNPQKKNTASNKGVCSFLKDVNIVTIKGLQETEKAPCKSSDDRADPRGDSETIHIMSPHIVDETEKKTDSVFKPKENRNLVLQDDEIEKSRHSESKVKTSNVKTEEVTFNSSQLTNDATTFDPPHDSYTGPNSGMSISRLYFRKSKPNREKESHKQSEYSEKMHAEVNEMVVSVCNAGHMSSDRKEDKRSSEFEVPPEAVEPKLKSMTEEETCAGSQTQRKKDPYFRCSICNRSFKDTESILDHLKSHVENDKPRLECHICKKKFRDHRHIRDHINVHTGDRPYSCKDCKESFCMKGHLARHRKNECAFLKMKHRDERDTSEDNVRKTASKKAPKTHADAVHYEIKKVKCDICNKMLLPESMKKHLMYHSDHKPYVCNICGMRFPILGNLKRHSLIHQDTLVRKREKLDTFQCELCSKSFWDKSHLSRHMTVHTGAKNFECDICGKKYPYKSGLNRHMLIHNGGPRIECGVCGQKFYDSSGLAVHLRTHTGEKPFLCEDCPEKFASKTLLRIHRGNVHKSGEDSLPDRYFCKQSSCKKGFQFKSLLRTHLACGHSNRSKNIRGKVDVDYYLETGKYWDGEDAPVHT